MSGVTPSFTSGAWTSVFFFLGTWLHRKISDLCMDFLLEDGLPSLQSLTSTWHAAELSHTAV